MATHDHDHKPPLSLSVDEARNRMQEAVWPVDGTDHVSIRHALGRVLAEDLIAPLDVPAHDNSAMDGYAFRGADLAEARLSGTSLELSVVGRSLAGHPWTGEVKAGTCVRIMTGAVMPAGADTVVPQEDCAELESAFIRLAAEAVKPGQNRRRRGEDLPQGAVALRAGRRLRPADLGLAASLGVSTLTVRRRVRVALFSTGDELSLPGESLPPGNIYDSNRYSIAAVLEGMGFEVEDLGRVPDDPLQLEAALRRGMEVADALITSGGVSVGDADHTRALLSRLGAVDFWSVSMRPGRPFAFGGLKTPEGGTRWLFALPGNPVAALVSLLVLAQPSLWALAGAPMEVPVPMMVRSGFSLKKRAGRTEFPRVQLRRHPADGCSEAVLAEGQGSGMLRSMMDSQALAVLDATLERVEEGDWLPVLPLDGLYI
jgi:molybdopterin molybdotransferase